MLRQFLCQLVQPPETNLLIKAVRSHGPAAHDAVAALERIVGREAQYFRIEEGHLGKQIERRTSDRGACQDAPVYRTTAHGT